MASHYDLPHRSVLNWLRGKTSPGPRRLKELCNIFGWEHAALFESEGRDEIFERKHLNLETLNRHYLSLQVRNPLEAWAYVALAGAIVFVDLAAAGFECRAVTDHHFGTRLDFSSPGLANVSLQIAVIFGRGLVIRWLDEQGLVRKEMDLTGSNLKLIIKRLRAVAGF